MSDSSGTAESTDGYIRGGAAAPAISRYAVQILIIAVLVSLAGLTIAYAVTGHNEASRRDRLHRYGEPVAVTVTSCRGEATGTGIIESKFFCRGGYDVNGHHYVEDITDSSAFIEPGTVIQGVVDSHDASVLSTAAAVATHHLRQARTPGWSSAAEGSCSSGSSGSGGGVGALLVVAPHLTPLRVSRWRPRGPQKSPPWCQCQQSHRCHRFYQRPGQRRRSHRRCRRTGVRQLRPSESSC